MSREERRPVEPFEIGSLIISASISRGLKETRERLHVTSRTDARPVRLSMKFKALRDRGRQNFDPRLCGLVI